MIVDSAKRLDYDSLSRQYADPTSLQYKKLRLVDSYITGGKNLLDFGTGTGELIKLEEKKFDNIYGIDSDEESVSICRTRFENDERIHIVENNANNITGTFAGIRFDCISACDVLEHLKFRDCLKLLDSFYSLLDTDGIFIFTGPGVFEKMKIMLGEISHTRSQSFVLWLGATNYESGLWTHQCGVRSISANQKLYPKKAATCARQVLRHNCEQR